MVIMVVIILSNSIINSIRIHGINGDSIMERKFSNQYGDTVVGVRNKVIDIDDTYVLAWYEITRPMQFQLNLEPTTRVGVIERVNKREKGKFAL